MSEHASYNESSGSTPWGPIVATIVFFAALLAIIAIVPRQTVGNDDDRAKRNAAIAVRSEQAFTTSNHVIAVWGLGRDHTWYPRNEMAGVNVIIGTCRQMTGYFRTPVSPKNETEVSELILTVSSSDRKSTIDISLNDPALDGKLRTTAAEPCIRSEDRLPGARTS